MRRVLLPAIAVLLCLSGCAQTSPSNPSSSGISSASPIESFDAQAKSTWDAYFVTLNRVFSGASASPNDLRTYATKAEVDAVKRQALELSERKLRITGVQRWRNFTKVTQSQSSYVALVCIDNSGSRVVDASGKDVTPTDRQNSFTLRLGFVLENGRLLLDKDKAWTQESAC